MPAILLLAACARSSALNPDEGFRRIQVHEASIAGHAQRLRDAADCQDQRATEAELCAETDALCAIARELDDADARTRCERAEDACHAARERVAHDCATQRAP